MLLYAARDGIEGGGGGQKDSRNGLIQKAGPTTAGHAKTAHEKWHVGRPGKNRCGNSLVLGAGGDAAEDYHQGIQDVGDAEGLLQASVAGGGARAFTLSDYFP